MSEKYITVENLKRFLKNADKRYSSVKNNASQDTNGLMSKEDKIKLDNIEANANNYVLPTASSTLGGVKTTSTVTSTSGLTACPIISGVPYYKDTNTRYSPFVKSGSSSASGLVPEPPKTQGDTRYLCEDGTWKEIDTDNMVHKTGNETIDGTKTFTSQIVGSIDKAEKDLNGNIITSTYATKSEIPTKVSDLTNDSGFITDVSGKADKATTLSGYGITDAYTKTQVDKKVSDLVNSAPETLDTLNELANALGNDPNFATTVANQIGTKANTSDLSAVATSGSYNDLSDKPTIPTVNNATLTIQKNGTTVKTFTANASANVTANITVPTKTSELSNDSGFLTLHNPVDSSLSSTSTNAIQNKVVTAALDYKADDEGVVHKSGPEVIFGTKTFDSLIKGNISGNADTATKATNNASGNYLSDDIIKGLSVSGKVITYTKLDGSKGTITTQDTNTDTKVTNTLNNTTKAYITGTTNATTNTGTQIFDTGVYLTTTAGQLHADIDFPITEAQVNEILGIA